MKIFVRQSPDAFPYNNELIYQELINEVFGLKGKERRESFYGVVKPFNLPSEPGVKYYDHETVEGGQFLTLLSNAKWVVDKQLRPALLKSGDYRHPQEYLDAQADKKGGRSLNARFPDEAWNPRATPAEFERVIVAKDGASDADLRAAIHRQFQLALQRPASAEELSRHLRFFKEGASGGGHVRALKNMMVSVLMEPEFVYRGEFGGGAPDAQGRRMLTPRELSYAIAYALTDRVPDEALAAAAREGRLASRDDVRREVLRLLEDGGVEKPRLLRFFQDYFGYTGIYGVFKDEERFIGAYNPHRVVSTRFIWRVPGKVSKEADTLVLWILKQDKDVLKQLLTTDRYFVQHSGDNEEMIAKAKKADEEDRKNRAAYNLLKGKKGAALSEAARTHGLYTGKDGAVNMRALGNDMWFFAILYGEDGQFGLARKATPRDPEGVEHSVKMYNLDHRTWSYEPVQPIPLSHRMGLLTHPAWLVSFSQNAATDPVRRGRWIREKLLAGFIPDIPITVDAKVPEDHGRTLRERFAVTRKNECWHCHQKMNPLGDPFESYDDFGRYRTEEMLEHPENILERTTVRARGEHGVSKDYQLPTYKTKLVDATGALEGSGDPALDGKVSDAMDLIARLAKADRVRQSFIRNVFRYFMGRNERSSDGRTLVAADRAYVESGGSFKALVVSLLTSDSFIYRK